MKKIKDILFHIGSMITGFIILALILAVAVAISWVIDCFGSAINGIVLFPIVYKILDIALFVALIVVTLACLYLVGKDTLELILRIIKNANRKKDII